VQHLFFVTILSVVLVVWVCLVQSGNFGDAQVAKRDVEGVAIYLAIVSPIITHAIVSKRDELEE